MIRVRLLHSYGNAVVTITEDAARRLIADGWAQEIQDEPPAVECAALRTAPVQGNTDAGIMGRVKGPRSRRAHR